MSTITAGGGVRGNLRGIGLILVGFALFSVTDALMKHLTGSFPLPQTVFFLALFSLVPIVGLALAQGGLRTLGTRRPGVQLLRGVLGMTAGYTAFFAYSRMPIADAYAILFSSPLIIAALSAVVFREKVDARRWAAIIIGFGGVLIMLRPTEAVANVGAFGALASALCFSLSAIVVRHWGRSETAPSFPFYGNAMGLLVLAPVLPFVYVEPTMGDVVLMALCGISAGTALTCLLTAFRIAPGPVVAPFQYTQMLWGVLFGWLVFGDRPGPQLLAGAGIVIVSGLYLLHREARAATPTDG